MKVPEGKTKAIVNEDYYKELFKLKKGDTGYIDGYAQGTGGPYAVFVREDGVISMASPYLLTAIE
tara:strand:- start:2002 stop:2196 length:195 start_codon:yes stop_codon:yes gene_type:complete